MGGIFRFSGKGSGRFAGAVRAELCLSTAGQKIVDVLHTVLRASVTLVDKELRQPHRLARSPDLPPVTSAVLDVDRTRFARASVNDRFTLVVSAPGGLHPDAQSLVKWAAEKLAPHLSGTTAEDDDDDDDEPSPPPSGGGGGSGGGAAEMGVPVWWARKIRSS